jgi:hypothetical protein
VRRLLENPSERLVAAWPEGGGVRVGQACIESVSKCAGDRYIGQVAREAERQ